MVCAFFFFGGGGGNCLIYLSKENFVYEKVSVLYFLENTPEAVSFANLEII